MPSLKCVDLAWLFFLECSWHITAKANVKCKLCRLFTSGRDSGRESTFICERKVSMSGRPVGRPWSRSWLFRRLYLWNRMSNSRGGMLMRYHHPINYAFDRHRYPPVPATARGYRNVPRRGCRRHTTLGNSTTAGPIAFKFCVCLETS